MLGERKRKRIVVVGGSLGGLFAGIALRQHGHTVIILERRSHLSNQGAGIMAGDDLLKFLEDYAAISKDDIGVPVRERVYLDRQGNEAHKESSKQWSTSWTHVYSLLREAFAAYTAHSDRGAYMLDSTVEAVQGEGTGARVYYRRNGELASIFGDLVIGADGQSSTIRRLLHDGDRTYAGYCVIRGTVPETEVTPATFSCLYERFCHFHAPNTQCVVDTIPIPGGDISEGHHLFNFVWYVNYDEGSPELVRLMTDKEGKLRRFTIPRGYMTSATFDGIKTMATEQLPPQMAELVHKTRAPFAQRITDVKPAHKNLYMNDKVVLVGDALAGFRPHVAASASHAAFNAMALVEWMEGTLSRSDFVKQTMQYARHMQALGVEMGTRSQYQILPLEEYIKDRQEASIERRAKVYEPWTLEGLEDA